MATNGKSVVRWTLPAAGLVVTVVVTLLASGGSWGRAKQQLAAIEATDGRQDAKLDYHDKEITVLREADATLRAHQDALFKALASQDAKLDQILRCLGGLPAGGARITERGSP